MLNAVSENGCWSNPLSIWSELNLINTFQTLTWSQWANVKAIYGSAKGTVICGEKVLWWKPSSFLWWKGAVEFLWWWFVVKKFCGESRRAFCGEKGPSSSCGEQRLAQVTLWFCNDSVSTAGKVKFNQEPNWSLSGQGGPPWAPLNHGWPAVWAEREK